MPGYSVAAKNTMLDALVSGDLLASLHTADPGATGGDEIDDAGSYSRQTITFNAASGGEVTSSNTPVFDVPESTTITHVGIWNSTGTTYYGGSAITQEVFNAAGTYTLTSATLDLNGGQ